MRDPSGVTVFADAADLDAELVDGLLAGKPFRSPTALRSRALGHEALQLAPLQIGQPGAVIGHAKTASPVRICSCRIG